MFIEKIRIRGYQSLYDVELGLGRFTVIYGQSDVGKSAVFRAFSALLFNESGDSFISKGVEKSQVAFVLHSGEAVAWIKRKKKSGEYRLKSKDGKQRIWTKNRTSPSEIKQLLRFGVIEVDGTFYLPNLKSQHDRMFMLFETPGKRARVLGSLVSSLLLKGVREANVRRNRNESDIRSIDSLADELRKKQAVDWDGVLASIKREQKILLRIDTAEKLCTQIQNFIDRREALERLAEMEFEHIPSLDFKRLKAYVDAYTDIFGLRSEKYRAEQTIKGLTPVLNEYKEAEKSYAEKFETLKRESMFPCPHCGKDISRLEIE